MFNIKPIFSIFFGGIIYMKNFFEEKGKLTVSLGYGYISAFEANKLKSGDVVIISRIAGESHIVNYNGSFLCYAELVVFDDIFGLFPILKPNKYSHKKPYKGVVDDVVEILSTEIRFAEIDISLKELFEVNEGPIIDLGKEYQDSNIVELFVAGKPIAKGDVVVVGESYGIKINEVYYEQSENIEVRVSGFLFDKNASSHPVKKYDFKRPDKFSKDNLMTLAKIHELFIKSLKIIAPAMSKLAMDSIDQLVYHEIIDTLKKKNQDFSMLIIGDTMREKPYVLSSNDKPLVVTDSNKQGSGLVKDQNKKLIQTEGLVHPMGDRIRDMLKTMTYGRANPLGQIIIFYKKDGYISQLFKSDDSINEFLLTSLRSGWKTMTNTKFGIIDKSDDITALQPIHKMEMCLTVKLTKDNDPDDTCFIVYPNVYLGSSLLDF